MKKLSFCLILTVVIVQQIQAGIIHGTAYLENETDHSGISVRLDQLSEPPPVPAVNWMAGFFLLTGISILLIRIFKQKTRGLISVAFLWITIGSVLILAEEYYYSDSTGNYFFDNIIPGITYSLYFEKDGFYPEYISPFIVDQTGNFEAPDVILRRRITPPTMTSTPVMTGRYWSLLSPSAKPAARQGHAMIYVPELEGVLMFGGRDCSNNYLDDL